MNLLLYTILYYTLNRIKQFYNRNCESDCIILIKKRFDENLFTKRNLGYSYNGVVLG